MRLEKTESWGRLTDPISEIAELRWGDEPWPKTESQRILPYGLGKSYGDSCLNSEGALCKTDALRLIKSFDVSTGTLTCGAGISLDAILQYFVPLGWFPPVVPGTKFITLGGAIANDIHGKNHHLDGTLSRHISSLTLLRSADGKVFCSRSENENLFRATIGGLGLTGIITEATIQLKKIQSAWLETEAIPFRSMEEFFAINKNSAEWEHTVSWVDLTAQGPEAGRGIFLRGRPSKNTGKPENLAIHKNSSLKIPICAPNWALNNWSVKAFNTLYQMGAKKNKGITLTHYDPFFFPLDKIHGWNKIYGRRGFYQYQSVIPIENGLDATREMLKLIGESKNGSFLAVMKTFGNLPEEGLLSFPKEGFTLAMDFPNQGKKTEDLFQSLDEIVKTSQGRLYPAKDARMTGAAFRNQYPKWDAVEALRDPKINSDFWRRVTNHA